MGEVHRALDTKLGREVAIKTLPPEVASDPDRLARFRREAQILASLNHENIAAIYGLEEAGGTPVLVLEMVEGEELAARLSRGPVPMEEALGLALQITEGLEEAHERGIVHRDLKPANIKVTPAGRVKILDFGLGKAYETSPSEAGDQSLSPTLTAAATRAGVILGTAGYMSPEQARGGSVDKRSDIWSFGCVLLEMISGARTFAGDTISDTLASILKSDPDWSSLPRTAPPSLTRLLGRCLEKDRRKRLRDIGEARLMLEGMLSGEPEEAPAEVAAPASTRGRALVLVGVAALAAAVTAAAAILIRPSPPDPAVQKYEFNRPGILLDESHMPALSPEGRRIVFATSAGLWIRDLGDLDPRLLAGTEQASHPAWSPDGAFLAYYRDGGIWKIPAQGGQAQSITVGISGMGESGGLSWSTGDRVVYADGSSGVSEVSSRGGEPRVIAQPDPGEVQDLHHPHALPDGRGVLYVMHRVQHTYDTIVIHTGDTSRILLQIEDQEIRSPVYAPTGHILYRRRTGNAGLWAVPFSLSRLEVTGEPFLVARDGSLPSAAPDGSLLYAWNASDPERQLTWLDREGNEIGTLGPVQSNLQSPAISPDGGRVAVMAQEGDARNIWVQDVERGTRMRLTFTTAADWDPAWSAEGDSVLFWEGKTRSVSMKPADGTGSVERLVAQDFLDSGLPSIAPGGGTLVFWVRNIDTKGDIYIMPLEGERTPAAFIRTPFYEDDPVLSPDGALLAYISEESGRREIYLTRFPSAEGKWQISVNGGASPRWDPRGGRLYYLQGNELMEVQVSTGLPIQLGTPRPLFTLSWLDPDAWWANRYAISPDGERFLFAKNLTQEGEEARIVLVRNWIREFDELP